MRIKIGRIKKKKLNMQQFIGFVNYKNTLDHNCDLSNLIKYRYFDNSTYKKYFGNIVYIVCF